jgi:hypothetical protein
VISLWKTVLIERAKGHDPIAAAALHPKPNSPACALS